MARRANRQLFELAIASVLDQAIPKNVEDIRRAVSEKLGKEASWNTVKKYLITLRDTQKIEELHAGKLLLYKRK